MVWVAQILTMGMQLVYAGVTSRAIGPAGFGSFAVALAATGLGGILASSGLANAAARRTGDDISGDRAIVTAAALAGLLVALVFALGAPLWARLWGNPDATPLIRALCIGLAVGSYGGVLAGIARRLGRIGIWTAATFASSVVAMLLGGWATYATREAWSLTVMPVALSVISSTILLVAMGRRGIPTRRLGTVGHDIAYGAKSLGSSLLTYIAYGLPMWSMSRWLGASTLGSWNRAAVVGQIPLESASRAAVTVIFPKFRWDRAGGDRVRRRWSALMATSAIVVLPLTALVVPAVPTVTRIILGSQWAEAGLMAQFILIATAVNVLNALLGSALEASNNFRAVWMSQIAVIATLTVACVLMLVTGRWVAVAGGYVIAALVSQAVQVVWSSRGQLLSSRSILLGYTAAATLSLIMLGIASAIVALASSDVVLIGMLVLVAVSALLALFALRNHIEPLAVLVGGHE